MAASKRAFLKPIQHVTRLRSKGTCEVDLADPLFEAPCHHADEGLLGGKKKPAGGWNHWAQSMRRLTGTSRQLGDGVPRSVYAEIGTDDARPLF